MASLVSEVKTSSPSAPVGEHLAGDRVDDLRVEVVLPDVQAVLGLHALLGHPGADHLGQAVDVHGVDGEPLLDLAPHLLGPRLGPEDPDPQRGAARVDALPLELVEQGQHVRRRHHDDPGAEVLDQLDLTCRHATRGGDDRAAEPLRSVVRAETAGEQAVPVGDVDRVAGAPARRADRTGHHVGPHGQVVLGVPDDGGPARGAARRVQPADPVLRHGEHPERVVRAQIGLDREGEARQVGQSCGSPPGAGPPCRRTPGRRATLS